MLHRTTFQEFQQLASSGSRVVVSKEIFGDVLTPVRAFQALASDCDDVALLDSSDHPTAQDACVYIGIEAIATFSSKGDEVVVTEAGVTQKHQGDAFQALREFYNRNKCDSIHSLAKFAGGMIGFVAYDAVRLFEDIPDRHPNEDDVPDLMFKCYGINIVFDKRTGKVLVSRSVEVEEDLEVLYKATMEEIDAIIQKMISAQSG
ncbi:MAG: hypothetical protein KDH94_00510, partial [Coxiellaceae bacterium]|nr:hypothetical protein [Coxiellaceae bacterium]